MIKDFNDNLATGGEIMEQDVLTSLADLRRSAPSGFTQRVMQALPLHRAPKRLWWPAGWDWLAPALAGAAATLLAFTVWMPGRSLMTPSPEHVVVQFELHAPGAERVELIGDFTAWQPDGIRLDGPDASGHWSVRVELPAGRHEYLFLVDGRRWVTDPLAPAHRPDGFGNLNSIRNL